MNEIPDQKPEVFLIGRVKKYPIHKYHMIPAQGGRLLNGSLQEKK
jgi:hypothetical protein